MEFLNEVASAVEQGHGQQNSGEWIEMKGLKQVAVEESCEGAGRSTAGAEEMEVSKDGAAGIEGVLIGWEAQQDCSD